MQDDDDMIQELYRRLEESNEWTTVVEADNEAMRAQVTELQYILTDCNSRITKLETMGDRVAESYVAETRMTAELRKVIIAREAELKADKAIIDLAHTIMGTERW